MDQGGWVFVTPAPGCEFGFDPHLIAALGSPSAPFHIWLSRPRRGFAMKLKDYQRWMETGGPIGVVSPQRVRMFRLDCGPQLDDVVQRLEAEIPQITKELAESARW